MIGRIKSWFTPPPERRGYVDQILSAQIAAAQGAGSVRSSAVYQACLNLISDAAATAELTGEHSEVLQPRLGAIARQMVDVGQSAFELVIGRGGGLELLPVEITNVTGGAEEDTWFYTLARSGPMSTMKTVREQSGVLNFRSRPSSRSPWRGQPSLPAGNTTAALLGELEIQLAREARVKPTRLITAGSVKGQGREVEESISRGGIISVLQAFATATTTDPSGIRSGVLRNETSAPVAALYEQLERAVCGALGVPAGLILSDGDGAAARENFRFFSASTIAPLLAAVQNEWQAKIGPLTYGLDELRASDTTARARALGSRSMVFKNLVSGGVGVERALLISGLDG